MSGALPQILTIIRGAALCYHKRVSHIFLPRYALRIYYSSPLFYRIMELCETGMINGITAMNTAEMKFAIAAAI